MHADIYTLAESDFYRVLDFKCRCLECSTSEPEYTDSFSISFVRKGNFLFNVFRSNLDSYTGCILICKPGFERTVTHAHSIPDECTIFEFKDSFYSHICEQFKAVPMLGNNDIHSTVIKANPALELLHFQTMQSIYLTKGRLYIDSIVLEIVQTVLSNITDCQPRQVISKELKQIHLSSIEIAKQFILQHFIMDISLGAIASKCHISVFHFTRIFKKITGYTPYQFLLNVRLKNAELLLKNSSDPVSDIAFSCGFNSIENFTYSFTKKNGYAPTKYRKQPLHF